MKQVPEYTKLDSIDIKVARWICTKHPTLLFPFLEYLTQSYSHIGVVINVGKLYADFIKIYGRNKSSGEFKALSGSCNLA